MVVAGPTFRGEFEELAFRGNAGAGVELSHKDEKNLWHTHADLPMLLVANVASTIQAMKTEEASISMKLASITDPVTAEAVRRMHNGAKHRPAPKAAAKPLTAAAATRAAEAKARKEANSTPLSPSSIMHARAAAALPAVGEAADQQWGTARGAAVVASGSRRAAAAAEQDAPVRAPTLAQVIAQQRARAAPAAAEAAHLEVEADDVALVLKTVHRLPQVGDRTAAKEVGKMSKLANDVVKAQAQLAAKMQAFRVAAQVATDATVDAASKAGYVAPSADPATLLPLGRGRGKPAPHR